MKSVISILIPFFLFSNSIFTEKSYEGWEQSFAIEEIECIETTNFQDILIFKNPLFGKILVLDGIVQLSELDEFIYHEMMAHVPLFSHRSPKNILVIGAGDGGLIREILKHPQVERLVWIDIDFKVIELCQKYLPSVCKNTLTDPRVELNICDGLEYLKKTNEKFDIIFCDSTDPIGPAKVLYTEKFFLLCKNALKQNGFFINQVGIPGISYSFFPKDIHKKLKKAFHTVYFYQTSVLVFIGGPILFSFATNDENFKRPDKLELQNKKSSIPHLKYYTPQMHLSAFSLPTFVKQKLLSDIFSKKQNIKN